MSATANSSEAPAGTAPAGGAAPDAPMDQDAIIRKYQELRSAEQTLLGRIADMQGQEHEYRVVSETIAPLEGTRKCYQLIGGVLVERTISDVLPIVKHNHEGIVDVLKTLSEQLAKTSQARQEHQLKYGIRTVSQAEAQRLMAQQQGAAAGGAAAGADGSVRASTGVLA